MTTQSPNPFPTGGLRGLSPREAMQRAAAIVYNFVIHETRTLRNFSLAAFTRLRRFACFLAQVSAGCAIQGSAGAMDLAGINYTDQYVALYTVNGYAGANIYPHEGGGGGVCCISVPREWKPGMTVTVKWTSDRNADPIPWKTRVVEVPRYRPEDRGVFAVHFFPNDEVKVLVTSITVGHPNYPFPEPDQYKQK
jgi:hypothetical protein